MMDYVAKSDVGMQRSQNQDEVVVIGNGKDQVLAAVCDGMGGHNAGEVASRVAMEHIVTSFRCIPSFLNGEEVEKWLSDTIFECDEMVKKMANTNKETKGMGTTVAIAVVVDDVAYLAHVGDSRIYIYDHNEFKQITVDHTLVNELLKRGAISEEAAVNHRQKNVLTQAVGAESNIKPSFYKEDVTHKSLLLCSDGLFNCLTDEEMYEIVLSQGTVRDKADQLINQANKNGGNDNISAVIIERDMGGNDDE